MTVFAIRKEDQPAFHLDLATQDARPIHFTGIGGIGMSGLAQILHARGYKVQGSDIADTPFIQTLRDQGMTIFSGHAAAHLRHACVLVASSAISPQNPEVIGAHVHNIPVMGRADMLAALMKGKQAISIGGTHGKTTTTSLMGTILDVALLDPTIINGGIMNRYASNVHIGSGDWIVVEADESDGTLVKLPTKIGILTNIDLDHMEFYKTAETLEQTFSAFIHQLPADGLGVLCVDNQRVRGLAQQTYEAPLLTYGFDESAHVRATNVHFTTNGMLFDVSFTDGALWPQVEISIHGEHNVLNSLSCIAVGVHLNIPEATIRQGLIAFTGVKRRFTPTGTVQGVTVIDDYAHHPEEIRAVLKTAKKIAKGRVIAVCQPHRYSRFSMLFDEFKTCFEDADELILLPIYAAGESALNISSQDLSKTINSVKGRVQFLESLDAVAPYLQTRIQDHDMVICMGAGNITQLAYELPHSLGKRDPATV